MITGNLKSWLVDVVLPFWSEQGMDQATGAFHERLTVDGEPDLTATRRLRVQARQIYVYSHAAVLGWRPDGGEIALRAFDAMMRVAHSPDGRPGFIHTMSPSGDVVSALRDSYDHAFIVLACAWLARATGEKRVLLTLEETLRFVDQSLTAADGALLEGSPPSEPRRQNPQMHWFEAMLALKATLDHPEARIRADRCLALFQTKLFDRRTRTLGEYFDQDWRPATGEAGDSVEPGHQAEWVWLLRQYERTFAAPRADLASDILDSTLRWLDRSTHLLIDEADRNGGARRSTRRSWLQTELAKAWIAETEAGRPDAESEAIRALEVLQSRYLGEPFAAGWIDQLDEKGRRLNGPVSASTLYHIFVAIAEADRVLGAAPRQIAERSGRTLLEPSPATLQ